MPAMAKRGGKTGAASIVIRREELIEEGHHGGAWKVAYADFVTAMMAFFLLMWLINATTEQQRRGIAAYFSPMANVENGFSGAGLVPGGTSPLDKGTSLVNKSTGSPPTPDPPQPVTLQGTVGQISNDADGSLSSPDSSDEQDSSSPAPPSVSLSQAGVQQAARSGGENGRSDQAGAAQEAAHQPQSKAASDDDDDTNGAKSAGRQVDAKAEARALEQAAAQIRSAVANDPSLAAAAGQMAIDVVPEGLRIQIMDSAQQPMFARGGTTLNDRAQALLRKVAPFLARLPEPISIGGYTDAAPWPAGGPSNWTLSAGRANAARDVMVAAGLPDARIANVSGFADRNLLLPADPLASANRRVVLTLRRQQKMPG